MRREEGRGRWGREGWKWWEVWTERWERQVGVVESWIQDRLRWRGRRRGRVRGVVVVVVWTVVTDIPVRRSCIVVLSAAAVMPPERSIVHATLWRPASAEVATRSYTIVTDDADTQKKQQRENRLHYLACLNKTHESRFHYQTLFLFSILMNRQRDQIETLQTVVMSSFLNKNLITRQFWREK